MERFFFFIKKNITSLSFLLFFSKWLFKKNLGKNDIFFLIIKHFSPYIFRSFKCTTICSTRLLIFLTVTLDEY